MSTGRIDVSPRYIIAILESGNWILGSVGPDHHEMWISLMPPAFALHDLNIETAKYFLEHSKFDDLRGLH